VIRELRRSIPRALGLSLTEVAGALAGDRQMLARILAAHEVALRERMHRLTETLQTVGRLRSGLDQGEPAETSQLARLINPALMAGVSFDLPWPWGGERFELPHIKPLTHIVGPLGSGKTRFARRLAETIPGAVFVGVDRLQNGGAAAQAKMGTDPDLQQGIERTLELIVDEGGERSPALLALLVAIEAQGPAALVIDMIEQGLGGRDAAGAYCASAPSRAWGEATPLSHTIEPDPRPRRRRRQRGHHPVPRQPQSADTRGALSRRAGL